MLQYVLYIFCTFSSKSFAQYLTNAVHKTSAATERINDLYCYSCETMDDGLQCAEFSVGNHNLSHMIKKCKADEFVCMVKRFSYTTSNENVTTSPKMWSLERKCAVNCEAGCFSIGERTKLYACTSCCEKSFCNTGTGGSASLYRQFNKILNIICPILLFFQTNSKFVNIFLGYRYKFGIDCF